MHDVEIITDIWYQIICRVIYADADTDSDQYNIIISRCNIAVKTLALARITDSGCDCI